MKVSCDEVDVNEEFGYNGENYRKLNEFQAVVLGRADQGGLRLHCRASVRRPGRLRTGGNRLASSRYPPSRSA